VTLNEKSCKSAKSFVKKFGTKSELSTTAVPVPVVDVVPPPSEKLISRGTPCTTEGTAIRSIVPQTPIARSRASIEARRRMPITPPSSWLAG